MELVGIELTTGNVQDTGSHLAAPNLASTIEPPDGGSALSGHQIYHHKIFRSFHDSQSWFSYYPRCTLRLLGPQILWTCVLSWERHQDERQRVHKY